MEKYLNAWTDLHVGEEELRAISQALDEAGVPVDFRQEGDVWLLDITFERVWGEGGQVPVPLTLRIEESAEHARERMADTATIAEATHISNRFWIE